MFLPICFLRKDDDSAKVDGVLFRDTSFGSILIAGVTPSRCWFLQIATLVFAIPAVRLKVRVQDKTLVHRLVGLFVARWAVVNQNGISAC